jgi:hypothetical protein
VNASRLDKVANTLDRFGGARASGGPVRAGTPYLVGENGPEIMVPSAAGRVLSASASRGLNAVGAPSAGVGGGAGGGVQRIQIELVGPEESRVAFRRMVRTMNLLQGA